MPTVSDELVAALVGKYIDGYRSTYVPPGWDHWVAHTGPVGYFNYSLTVKRILANVTP